jgi:hypothetical protein
MLHSFQYGNKKVSYQGEYQNLLHNLKRMQKSKPTIESSRPGSAASSRSTAPKQRPSTASHSKEWSIHTLNNSKDYEFTNPVKAVRDFDIHMPNILRAAKTIKRPQTAQPSSRFEIKDDRGDFSRKNFLEVPHLPHDVPIRILDFQNNHIPEIKNLNGLYHLVFLDFFNNQIEKIDGLDSLYSLKVLMLGRNRIKRIQGLDRLLKLEILDLHQNRIEKLENLNHLSHLRILNIEDNSVGELPLLSLPNLSELNAKKNYISYIATNQPWKKLVKFHLSHNNLCSIASIEGLLELPNVSELSFDENPLAEQPQFKTILVARLQSLKLLDGKRILDETKRSAVRIARREEMRRKDEERRAGYLQEREKYISQIQKTWNLLYGTPKSQLSEYELELEQTMQQGRQAYVELDGTVLYIYGNGTQALSKAESQQAQSVYFDYIQFEWLAPLLPTLTNFKNLTTIEIKTTQLTQLHQLEAFSSLKQLQKLYISEENPVTQHSFFRPYTMFLIGPSLVELCGLPITSEEYQLACNRFGTFP